jgi:deoxyribose-phosphate aldolase
MSSPNSVSRNAAPFDGWHSIAKIIDHTNLRPEATSSQIINLCEEAKEFGFGAVMLNPCYVEFAHSHLEESGVKVGTVVGFPLGATLTSAKRFETIEALRLGAAEIDMVQNIGALKSGNRDLVFSEIRALAEVVHDRAALLKVILETGLLSDEEKVIACELSERAGADFVKTSTGFLGGVATVQDVALMRRAVRIGVKASGGIRTASDAKAMIEAGANRLGTSSGVNIIRELRNESAIDAPSQY